jgi:hypothetical protein
LEPILSLNFPNSAVENMKAIKGILVINQDPIKSPDNLKKYQLMNGELIDIGK